MKIAAHNDGFSPPVAPILLIQGQPKRDIVITHPLNTTATSSSFLEPKYGTLRTITFEGFGHEPPEALDAVLDFLQSLPAGFVRDPYFGLGLNWYLHYLINAIEEIEGVTDLKILGGRRRPRDETPRRAAGGGGLPTINLGSYTLTGKMFDDARKAINRAHDKALNIAAQEKRVFAHNTLLTAVDPATFPPKHRPYRKDAILEAIGGSLARSAKLSNADRDAVVFATKSVVRTLGQSKPAQLLELSREIELVTLETLLKKMGERLKKKLPEANWQNFFIDNPFVLRLAFGLPIIMMGDQVSVGGRKFDGSGEKISDFAVKAVMTGNLSLVEIKTRETPLLEHKAYRGSLYAPSRALTGAVNQVLDQRYQLQKSITVLKDSSNAWDVESYAVQGLIIAGQAPEGAPQLKSFELFRNSLKSVTIVTFDELMRKLEHLLEVLGQPANAGTKGPAKDAVNEEELEDDALEDLEEDYEA